MVLKKDRIKKMCTENYDESDIKELLSYAIPMGCKTEIEFTMFLKARESISNF